MRQYSAVSAHVVMEIKKDGKTLEPLIEVCLATSESGRPQEFWFLASLERLKDLSVFIQDYIDLAEKNRDDIAAAMGTASADSGRLAALEAERTSAISVLADYGIKLEPRGETLVDVVRFLMAGKAAAES